MVEQGFEVTTVADITERANVGRSTFYAHFADKEDLLQESLQGLRAFLSSQTIVSDPKSGPTHPALTFSLPMLTHVSAQKALFSALMRTGHAVQEHMRIMLLDLVSEALSNSSSLSSSERALQAHFITGSFQSVLGWWMQDPTSSSAEEVVARFRALVLGGLPSG
jgi:AcrR family transcriptional regulator